METECGISHAAAGVPRCTGSTDRRRRWCEVPEAAAVAAVEFLVVVIATRRWQYTVAHALSCISYSQSDPSTRSTPFAVT